MVEEQYRKEIIMNNEYYNSDIEIDIVELIKHILKKMKTIIFITIGCGAIMLCVSIFFLPKSYVSNADISIIPEVQDLDYTSYITGSAIIDKVSNNLKVDKSTLVESVNVTRDTNNLYNYRINVMTNDPELSCSITKNIIKVFKNEMTSKLGLKSVTVINNPSVNSEPVSPNVKKNVITCSLISFFICLSLTIVFYLFSKRFKSSQEVENYLGVSVLGEIPIEK